MRALRHSLLILLATVALILSPQAAQAAALSCNGAGSVAGGTLYEADPANHTGACETIGNPGEQLQHIFSIVVCNFVMILNDVLGGMYCGLQFSMQTILGMVLTVYIIVFGVQILMGTAQANSKEIILRLLKIAGVWMFATQSLWGINMGFGFFVSLITSGIWWVTHAIMPAEAGGASDSVMPVYAYIDSLIFATVMGPLTGGGAKLFGFFVLLLSVMPTLTLLAGAWLWMTLITLARTLIGFMLAVSAIAFLIALSPIFMSFMLFQSTFHLFETWLRYMLSYSLQIIIIFAVIALWVMVIGKFVTFFGMLSDLIFDFRVIGEPGAFLAPSDTYGICPPIYNNSPFGPTAVCPDGFNPLLNDADKAALLQPSRILRHGEFLYFVTFHLISLSLIAYAFNALMRDAPEIAKHIVGPAYAPVMVGGWGMDGMSWLGKRNHRGSFGSLGDRARTRLDNAFGGSGDPTSGNNAPGLDFVEKMRRMVETRK
jgi:hypothetical protein